MFNQTYCRMWMYRIIKNYQYHMYHLTRKKNIHRTSILVPPCHCEPPEGKVRGRYGGFSPSSNLSGCGAMAFLSTRSLQRRYACDMPRWWFISKGKKMWIWEKYVFQFAFFWLLLKGNNIHQKGKKMQPTSTNQSDSRFTIFLPIARHTRNHQTASNKRATSYQFQRLTSSLAPSLKPVVTQFSWPSRPKIFMEIGDHHPNHGITWHNMG